MNVNKTVKNGRAKDDLKLIRGIGPYLEQRLNEIGLRATPRLPNLMKWKLTLFPKILDHFPPGSSGIIG